MGRQPHIVVVPLPAQGHVKPLIYLSHKLVDHGIKVTFDNTEFIRAKVTSGMSMKEIAESRIRLASVPDGLETEKDRNNPIKFRESFKRVMPGYFINLIEEINNSSEDAALYKSILGKKKKATKFLLGLNKDLDDVRGRIMGIKPSPSLQEVYYMVRHEESRRLLMMGAPQPQAREPDGF